MNHSPSSSAQFSFLHKLPWEKVIIWSGFLEIIYVLRHFFFIIFLTFLLSYSMRTLVVRLCRPFAASRRRGLLETIVAFFCFLALVIGLYRIGSMTLPELARQGQALAKRVASPKRSPQAQFDEYLTSTVGRWLFQQKYGDKDSLNYREAYDRFRSPEQQREHFLGVMRGIETSFEDYLIENSSTLAAASDLAAQDAPLTLEEWVLQQKAPQEYALDKQGYTASWEEVYRKQEFQIPGLKPLDALSHSEREAAILRFVTTALLANESTRITLTADWELDRSRRQVQAFQERNPDLARQHFERFFERVKEETPYALEEYVKLRAAAAGSIAEFQKALKGLQPGDESASTREDREREAFEKIERASLYAEWKKGELAGKLQEKLEEHALALMSAIGGAIGQIVPKLLVFPMELLTALLLSFLITIDVPRLRAGLEKLAHTRFRHVYWEIKPGLVSFGLLIGRAFQAQGVIALVNAALTWMAIHFLGIQNAAFLCFIVFLCSFVPVLGVVFSSVPIAVMALTQDGGSLGLAVWSIVAILFIHFLETSIFNPRIVGNMLHLHPVLVLAILAICEHFFGVWGLLLGVPVFVYIIRFVILQEGIPGFIEMPRPLADDSDLDE